MFKTAKKAFNSVRAMAQSALILTTVGATICAIGIVTGAEQLKELHPGVPVSILFASVFSAIFPKFKTVRNGAQKGLIASAALCSVAAAYGSGLILGLG